MRKKYTWIFILLLVINFLIFYKNEDNEKMFEPVMKEQNDTLHKHKIDIQKPNITNKNLKDLVTKKLNLIEEDFLRVITNVFVQEDSFYSLYVRYKTYNY